MITVYCKGLEKRRDDTDVFGIATPRMDYFSSRRTMLGVGIEQFDGKFESVLVDVIGSRSRRFDVFLLVEKSLFTSNQTVESFSQ